MCYVLVPGADGLQSTGAPAAVVRKGAALCWYCKLQFHGIYYQAFDRKEIQQLVNSTVQVRQSRASTRLAPST